MDSKNLGMLGLSPEEAQQFLRDLEAINAQYQPRISAELDAVSQANADYRDEFGFYDPRDPFYQPPKIEVSKALTDEYAQAFFGLTNRYGINPVIEGTDKVYYLDPGIQGINPYGPQAQFNDPIGTRPGMFTRDSRTEGDFSWRNAVPAALKALVNPLNYIPIPGIGGSDSVGVPWITAGREGIEGGLDTNYGVGEDVAAVRDAIANFADSQGTPVGAVDLPEHPLEKVADTIGGLLGGPESIFGPQITIPGLPFPIPGTMTWQDLLDMAKSAGKSVLDVLNDITSGGQAEGGNPEEDEGQPIILSPDDESGELIPGGLPGSPVFQPEEESDPVFRPGAPDGFVTPGFGRPSGFDAPSSPPITPGFDAPPANPTQPSFDGPVASPDQNTIGLAPSNERPALDGGSGITWPGLVPPVPEPEKQVSDFSLWDYIGPDTSWGVETPDYGSPTMRPLFDFEQQPSQPIPVAPEEIPRTPFLSPTQQAQERQDMISDMIRRGLL